MVFVAIELQVADLLVQHSLDRHLPAVEELGVGVLEVEELELVGVEVVLEVGVLEVEQEVVVLEGGALEVEQEAVVLEGAVVAIPLP